MPHGCEQLGHRPPVFESPRGKASVIPTDLLVNRCPRRRGDPTRCVPDGPRAGRRKQPVSSSDTSNRTDIAARRTGRRTRKFRGERELSTDAVEGGYKRPCETTPLVSQSSPWCARCQPQPRSSETTCVRGRSTAHLVHAVRDPSEQTGAHDPGQVAVGVTPACQPGARAQTSPPLLLGDRRHPARVVFETIEEKWLQIGSFMSKFAVTRSSYNAENGRPRQVRIRSVECPRSVYPMPFGRAAGTARMSSIRSAPGDGRHDGEGLPSLPRGVQDRRGSGRPHRPGTR